MFCVNYDSNRSVNDVLCNRLSDDDAYKDVNREDASLFILIT